MVEVNSFVIGIGITLVAYVLIGGYAGRLVDDMADYYVAGRNAPTLLVVGTLVASFLSTVTFLGEMGFIYNGYGYVLLMLIPLNAAGYVVGSYFFGRYIYQMEPLTIPEYFGRRFDSGRVRIIAGLTLILGISVYLIAITQGLSLLLADIAQINYGWSLLIVILAYVSFTFYSGSQGVLITDTIMFVVFVAATVIGGPLIMITAGGWPDVIQQLASTNPDMLSWHGYMGEGDTMGGPIASLMWAITLGFVWGMVVSISPWQSSRYIMAKDEHTILRSGLFSMGIIMLVYLILVLSVPSLRLINTDISPSEMALVWAAQNTLPLAVGIVVLSGVVAAGLSSCSTFLSLVGFSLNRDLAEVSGIDYFDDYTEENFLRLSRLFMVVVAAAVFMTTYFQPPAVMWIGYFAATLFAASWGPISFISIYSKRVTEAGAFWGIIVGFFAVIIIEALQEFGGITLPPYLHSVTIGFVLSTAAIVVMSYLTEPSPTAVKRREEMVRATGGHDLMKVKRTVTYSKVLMCFGVLLSAILYVFWYQPFVNAVGMDSMNGNLGLVIYYGFVPLAVATLLYGLIKRWDIISVSEEKQATVSEK